MTGGGPKQKAEEHLLMEDRTRRDDRMRAGEDEFNEAANLLAKRGAKKRVKRRKIWTFRT